MSIIEDRQTDRHTMVFRIALYTSNKRLCKAGAAAIVTVAAHIQFNFLRFHFHLVEFLILFKHVVSSEVVAFFIYIARAIYSLCATECA